MRKRFADTDVQKYKTHHPIIIISGIYLKNDNQEKERFLKQPKIEAIKNEGLLTLDNEKGDIRITLTTYGDAINIIRTSSKAEIEFINENGNKTYQLGAVPIVASLSTRGYDIKSLEVKIEKMDNDNAIEVLYSGGLSE